jgi:hypothetical protein
VAIRSPGRPAGLTENDVNIELEDNVLTISGERKAEHEERKEGYFRVERASGTFSRSLTLPEGVDPERVQASFDQGVLEVRIPKPEQRKPRKVTISAGASATQTIEDLRARRVRTDRRLAPQLHPPLRPGFLASPPGLSVL